MQNITVELTEDDWTIVLSWYGVVVGEGLDNVADDKVLRLIERQIKAVSQTES